MKKETSKTKLNPSKAFDLNRLNNNNNFETGLSATVGFDYKLENKIKNRFIYWPNN